MKADFVPGEILVRFRSGASVKNASHATMTARSFDGREIPVQVERFDEAEVIDGLRLAHVAPKDTLDAITAMRQRPDVLYAEPNYIRRKTLTPNDPEFSNMWALNNTDQQLVDNHQSADGLCPSPPCTFPPDGPYGYDIKAIPAWDITTGSHSVVVGIVDEGIDISHPDLKDNIWTNPSPGSVPGISGDVHGYDFVHNTGTVFAGNGTYPKDQTDAHGTHVAGTVGASGNNGVGVVGVNWQVSLMSIKVLGPDGGKDSDIIRGYSYAKQMRDLWVTSGGTKGANIRVLNNSYGGLGRSQAALDAINALNDSGILFVAAAGNDSQDNDRIPHYPASYGTPNMISVAATDEEGSFATFSDYGARSVNIAAPGKLIVSTTPNGTYDFYSGTSMASPHVAGVAALICAAHPDISLSRLRAAILYSGDFSAELAPTTFEGTTTGVSAGRRLNALAALQNAAQNDTTPPALISDFHLTAQSGRKITLGWTAPGDDGNTGRASLYQLRFSDSDLSTPAQFDQARPLVVPIPAEAGTAESVIVKPPFRHPTGFIGLRAVDKAGNTGPIASISISIDPDLDDPYIVTESAPSALSTGGTPLGLIGDDMLKEDYQLPFSLFTSFDGSSPSVVTISTNGVLYISAPPRNSNGGAGDANSSAEELSAYYCIAGLWDDLRTDRRPGDDVYVVQPDTDHIIFRWQAVTFDTPLPDGTSRGENPVNFEIELGRDGTIQMRYGDGNQKLFPVVGVAGGDPDAYLIDSHTSDSSLINLTNAPTVTFTPRPVPTDTISGHVYDTNGKGLSGIWVNLNGPQSASTQTDAEGAYSFTIKIDNQWYNTQASKIGYFFNPAIQSFENSNTQETGLDFTMFTSVTIHGRVTDSNNNGISGVNITITTNNTPYTYDLQTDSNGYYMGGGNFGATTVITPSKEGLVFNPPSQTLSYPTGDQVIFFTVASSKANPIDDAQFFVTQHYLDFLNRQPDQAGLNFWVSQITSCNGDPVCIDIKRQNVSAAYFLSREFQETGFFVIKVQRVAFGHMSRYAADRISYQQFLTDSQTVGKNFIDGVAGADAILDQNKTAYVQAIVSSANFLARYPNTLSASAYVDALFTYSGVFPSNAERQAAVSAFGSGDTVGRAAALRKVAESDSMKNAEFNSAFVLLQYFGYLRRNPTDPPDNNTDDGYQFWLGKLDSSNGDYIGSQMVRSFIISTEYRLRFGPP